MSDEFPHQDYRDLIEELKASLLPPEGAFTQVGFTEDMGLTKDKAKRLLDDQVEAGVFERIGKYPQDGDGNGHPCYWYKVVGKPDS